MAELIQQIEIDAPIEAVWAEITKLGAVQRPLLDTVLATTPGEQNQRSGPTGDALSPSYGFVSLPGRPGSTSVLSQVDYRCV